MTSPYLLAFRIETRSPMCASPSTHRASGCDSSCPTCARPSVTDELPHGTDLGGPKTLLLAAGGTSPNPSETQLALRPSNTLNASAFGFACRSSGRLTRSLRTPACRPYPECLSRLLDLMMPKPHLLL